MNGMVAGAGGGGPVGGMPLMNNGTNGTGSRTSSDQDPENNYEARLNTYIYDYFLKNEQFECARALLKTGTIANVSNAKAGGNRRRDGDINGVDDGAMDTDSKGDLDSKRPDDLPLPEIVGNNEGASFLLEWFSLFWDVFHAQRKSNRASAQAAQYVQHTQQQSRMRQEQQQQYVRAQTQMMPGMNQYQNMMRMQANGMQVNSEQLRRGAMQNANRNVTPQQMNQMARNQQQMMQQQMQRDGSDIDINGQRPRTPSSGDNAPSPSKRPRLAGPPFNGQGMMPNGRGPQALQGQGMMTPNGASQQANQLLMQHGIDPNYLSQQQLSTFTQQNPDVQKKSIQVYAQNMAQQHRNNMPQQPGMPNQGSPMMQSGMDLGANMGDFYGANPAAMRMGSVQAGAGAGGNHALQDYQMQLMLLEQQNKKRLLMARQEVDNHLRPGEAPMAGQPGFPTGMSPQGSRSGPSPNPNDQMKRGTPKMGQVGLPESPMPDGSMPQARGSPAAMHFANMQPELFPGMKMADGMAGPNGVNMRPPSSHPGFNGAQLNQQQMEAMARAQGQNAGRMPNGNWQQGPGGQAPMMPQLAQGQQPPQMGTPQQRNDMPPPQAPPAAGATNGRPEAAAAEAPPTPSQTNKANPKKKNDAKEPRKRPTKKSSTANLGGSAATPASEADQPPITPTPSTPITPQHPNSFNAAQKNGNGQAQAANMQATGSGPPAANAPGIQQAQPDVNDMGQFGPVDNIDHPFDMSFANLDGGDVLGEFDFDSFLQDSGGHEDLNFDASMAFGAPDGVEAGNGEP